MIREEEVTPKFTFKFLLVGDSNVGKTSLVHRFCRDDFDECMTSTISVEFMTSILKIDQTPIKLQIWDTAGQEEYKSLGKAYYRNAVGVLLCFSLTSQDSFSHIEEWYQDVRKLCNPNARIVLVGTKCDLVKEKKVADSEAKQFAQVHDIEYMETSSKTNTNVQDLFYTMTQDVLKLVLHGEIDCREAMQASVLNNKQTQPKRRFC
ncbi:GTPase protein [Trichomonas vaginalis G3]|uniref:GTPase protein n=1 Tax=Trichomonas vaginalis (strain ATCC PRA-98 / G3) TaxID=412133 RepID=UPI0021E54784|nr:GTPase protein [Trichomonas vaginalis G3]KAI5542437.1 GTPase protein [Trichomonas vaginalis G3]